MLAGKNRLVSCEVYFLGSQFLPLGSFCCSILEKRHIFNSIIVVVNKSRDMDGYFFQILMIIIQIIAYFTYVYSVLLKRVNITPFFFFFLVAAPLIFQDISSVKKNLILFFCNDENSTKRFFLF